MAQRPLDLALQWPAKVAEEILLAPWTIAKVRQSLTDLPQKIDELTARLEAVGHLDKTVDRLAVDLADFKAVVGGVDKVVSELSEAILNLMGSIPGVRRAVRPSRS